MTALAGRGRRGARAARRTPAPSPPPPARPTARRSHRPRTTVRHATAADAAVIEALRQALRHEDGAAAPALSARRTTAGSRGGRQVTLLAEQAGRVVGVLRCTARSAASGRFGWVSTVYVAPGRRRRGVLRALLSAADAWCRRRGLAEMRLHCTVGNAEGNAAWTALGFTPSRVLYRRAVGGG